MFNIGDKVVCTNNTGVEGILGTGEVYTVLDFGGSFLDWRFKSAKPASNAALAVITRNERGTLDYFLFSDEIEMEKVMDECCTWRDKVICKKVIEWNEGDGL